ncbi:hypothetical protein AURDEDRAFT_172270 [Auricularia subglabra TFB-10046 SS5]|nr:hypothetical protein AURDEDRAFT_172270 [Auricularia subglabra TFB-10046 SS5]
MPDPTRLTLPASHCPVVDCARVVKWWCTFRGMMAMTVGLCPGHGIVYLRNKNVLTPFFFAIPRTVQEVQVMLHTPWLCILCANADNFRCTFMLCRDCCAAQHHHCRLRSHVEFGSALFPTLALEPLQELKAREVDICKRVKMTVYCTHFWPHSPVRPAGSIQYHVQMITRRSEQCRFPFKALSSASLCILRLDGVAIDRIRYAHNLLAGPAFDTRERALYTTHGSTTEIRLFVYATVWELGRHIGQLAPEEFDLLRDWDTLGTVNAHVNCHFRGTGMTTGWKIIELPRRRLIIGDCKFYLGDFSPDARAQLSIENVDDSRINDGPTVALDVEPYEAGGNITDVEIWLYVRA